LLKEKTLITFIREFNGPENYSILRDHLGIDLGNAHADLGEHLSDDLHFHEQTARPGISATSHGDVAIDNFFVHFLRTLLTTERGGKNQTFRVGDGFMASWNLNEMSEKPLSKLDVFLLAIKTFFNSLLSKIKTLLGSADKPS
jgi:hypothetical protein